MSRVERWMSRNVLVVAPGDSLAHAAQVMVERKVGSACIVDEHRLVGILTERDMLRCVARGLVPWSTRVAEVMTHDPATAAPSTTAGQALSIMLNGGFRHLPVVQDGELVGIVSLRDLAQSRNAREDLAAAVPDFETLGEPW